MTPGLCPITGEAAALVQEVSPALLRGLWRRTFGVEPTPLPATRIGIWRAPCGLVFFAPAMEGDAAFYSALYRRLDRGGRLRRAGRDRAEYPHAAARIAPGDSVLEVGAGASAMGERRAPRKTPPADLPPSPKAAELLESLLVRAHASPFRRPSASELLTPDAFRLLESVVFQYNRIQGILAAKAGSAVVQRLEPEIQAAAGEAVGAALHHAAAVQRFPESLTAHQAEIQARTRLLTELAEHLERDEAARDGAAYEKGRRLQDVVATLRSEAEARSELGLGSYLTPCEEPVIQRVGSGE
ncbi:MAG: hypothetical protein ACK4PG_17050 [Acetobacteraceae bacterium]